MLFSASLIIAAAASLVSAQTSNGTGVDHQITVGQNGLAFNPPSITAAVGDTVTFVFYAKNHTVTQSAFATPCTPLQNNATGQVGFDSGFVPVAANATNNPAWTIQVTNATAPIWFFCRQTGHCGQGMVGAINAPTSGNKTFDAFLALAKGTASSTSNTTTTGGSGSTGSTGSTGGTGSTGSTGNTGSGAMGRSVGLALFGFLGAMVFMI